ncbi:MAG: beta-galactosidase [Phycisphaerales bacterium]
MLDGRRLWIVSASIHFQRVEPEEWADRIHAARLAGFNTIETPIFWAAVEPRPGQFDFSGGNDVKKFVEAVGAAGMHCILRPGPFVGAGWDLGGLPAWLLQIPEMRLRTNNQPFLEACSRYISALADQVRPRQVTSTGKGGAVLLIQNESAWTCGDDELAGQYLGELSRYLRESGLTVPKINTNNLWQAIGVEGEIDGWVGDSNLLATLRQLAIVRPTQPRVIVDFGVKSRPVFGEPAPTPPSPAIVQRRLAEILAGGGQFNYAPFACGLTKGFWSGQRPEGEGAFYAPVQDMGAPIDAGGAKSEHYNLVRRLATFATRFARVFANLDPEHQPIILDPAIAPGGVGRGGETAHLAPIVSHARGAQGDVAFIFSGAEDADLAKKPALTRFRLLLPDGTTMPVDLGRQGVAWCLFDVNLSARATLDYCSLNAFGAVGDVFVCFGPAGGLGAVSINGTPLEVVIPKGRKPLVEEVEGVHVVVCSGDMIDETFLADDAVYVGVDGLSATGEPIPGDGRPYTRVGADGATSNVAAREYAKPKLPKSGKVALAGAMVAPAKEQVSGSSPRFAAIPGPADLGVLGAPYGYGWYRLTIANKTARKVTIAAPRAGDRLHLTLDGEHVGVLGVGPGAAHTLSLSLKSGKRTITVLADNMGRASAGVDLAAPKGIPDHLWVVEPFKAGKASVEDGAPIEPLKKFSPLMRVRVGDATAPRRVTWSFTHRKKAPLFVRIPALPARYVVVLNDEPIRFVEAGTPTELVLEDEATKRGGNTLQLAPMIEVFDQTRAGEEVEAFAKAAGDAAFYEGVEMLTDKGEWAFCKWEPPAKTAYKKAGRELKVSGPTWWRASVDVSLDADIPVELDLTGMTKGIAMVNGQTLGRYFVTAPGAGKVGPVTSIPIPRPLLKDKNNEVIIFDEHGGTPSRCKIVYLDGARPVRAAPVMD